MTSRHGPGLANHDQPRANPPPSAVVVDEGFDDVTTLEGAGWFIQNNSNPIGDFTWGQGNPVSNGGSFDAFDGDPDAYVSANFESTDGVGTINNWLVTPTIAFGTGSSVSFYTRTVDDPTLADRLEVRLCTADPCTNVGVTAFDTGDFGTLLLSINPNLEPGGDPTGQNGYPTSWTQFTIASGLPTSGNGRIAFRYFVTDGGPAGDNSDFIGVDRVVIDNGSTGGGGDPIIGVSPTSLSASLAPNQTTTQTLTIANSGGSNLNWTIDEAASKAAMMPHVRANTGAKLIHNAPASSLSLAGPSLSSPVAPWHPLGDPLFQYDDGTVENSLGFGNSTAGIEKSALFLDHFTATGALTIDSVSVLWFDHTHVGGLIGQQPNIVAYYDASGSGDPSNAVRLGADNIETIGSENTFENYPVSFSVPGAGDVYVGFTDAWAADGTFTPFLHVGALDLTASAGESWLVATGAPGVPTDIDTLSNNDLIGTTDLLGFAGNWMIRATGSSGGGGGGCSSPSDLPWVSVSPTSGTAAVTSSSDVTVTYDSTGLSPGSYDGLLCVGSNDPATPSVEVPVSLTVTSGGGGGNGIILSGPLNHAVVDNVAGTTLNMTTSALDDTGPISGDWDFNFYDAGGFSFYTIATYATQYVVDNTGNVVVLHVGDVVGPSSLFSNNAATGNVPSAPAWAAGTDGYAGVMFNCDGRLPNPVPGGVCYGFVHITTTGSTGFPAFIADTGFDGDGNAITITGGGGGGDPSATVTPPSLDFTVAANATATQTLNIANAVGSDPLTYSIETRSSRPTLIPHVGKAKNRGTDRNVDIGKLEQLDRLRHRLAPQLASHSAPAQNAPAPWAPVGVDGTPIVFEVDDGTYEQVIGLNNGASGGNESFGAVWVNRFTATGPLTIDSISIEWPSTSGLVTGMQPNLLVYYDASASGDLSQAVRLGTDTIVTIDSFDAFESYTTSFSVPGTGDVYIGFVDAWALVDGGFEGLVSPAAIDEGSAPGAAYLSGASASGVLTDLNNLANNDLTGSAASFGFPGNWMVRATATGGGGGGPCTGPIVNWLTATPPNGTVAGGTNTDVSIKADPTAGGLAAGAYTGEVCVTTNDPAHALIAVPVSLTVTPVVAAACSGGADEIFCDGFDPAQSGTVVSGTINQPVADNGDGSSFDFALGDYHAYDASITTDDINLYDLSPGGMFVYWYADVVPPQAVGLTGGVVDAGGIDFAVLHSGDKIGPSSVLSAASIAMTNWQGGADGYVGVAFWNESTSAVNYGYIHLTTHSPAGFPVQALEWAYDNSGAAITIP